MYHTESMTYSNHTLSHSETTAHSQWLRVYLLQNIYFCPIVLFWLHFYCSQTRSTRQLIASAFTFHPEDSRIESWKLGLEGRNFRVCVWTQKGPPGGDRLHQYRVIPPSPTNGGHHSPAFRGGPYKSSPCLNLPAQLHQQFKMSQ